MKVLRDRVSPVRLGRVALLLSLFLLLLLVALVPLATAPALAQGGGVPAYIIEVRGPITPVTQAYIERGVEQAEMGRAAALVIVLDTPGGSLNITREIVERMRSARVPVIVYVAPNGATAASAGTIITLAGHAAVMAPGTSIGAASPVSMEGEMGEVERRKAENIVIADLKALTERRGPQVQQWVEDAVRQSAALSASEALQMGVVDATAPSVEEALIAVDGLTANLNGAEVTLNTAGAPLRRLPMNLVEQFLHTILDPNIAFILITIGINALIFELSSPGGYVGGVVGAICLLLGFFALGVLNVNWTGLGLIILAFILFVAEVKAPTHGILTLMGIISFVLGSLVLFNSPIYRVSWVLVASVALFSAAFFAFVVAKAVAARLKPAVTGREALIGEIAEVRQELRPQGMVFLQGELWQAESCRGTVPAGEKVRVIAAEGLRLVVEPLRPVAPACEE